MYTICEFCGFWYKTLANATKFSLKEFSQRIEFRRDCQCFLEDIILSAPLSVQLPLVPCLSKGSAVSALNLLKEVMIILPFTSIAKCLMGYWNLAVLGDPILRLRRLNFIPSFVKSNKRRRTPADHVLQSTPCLHFATSVASILGVTYTKSVSGGAFESPKSSYDSANLLFWGFCNW